MNFYLALILIVVGSAVLFTLVILHDRELDK